MKRALSFLILLATTGINAHAQTKGADVFTMTDLKSCSFSSAGKNLYFILEPGYQLILQGTDGKDFTKLVITVTDRTRKVGNVETRIVEEKETVNGKPVEVSRNFFAFCKETNSACYFGEEVDMYKNGKIINHEGAWLAEGKNKAGVTMPGLPKAGTAYYQELAPGVAMDRAKVLSITEKFSTPAAKFINCIKTEETSAIETKDKEYKWYAPGVGLIKDEKLVLVKYGYVK